MSYGFQSEPCFANLFKLLAATQSLVNGTPSGTDLFVTTSRVAQPMANVTAAQQPALYIMEGEVDYGPDSGRGLSRDEMAAAAIVYFRTTTAGTIPSQTLNAVRDAIVYQLRQMTLDRSGNVVPLALGEAQTLGGTCSECYLKGRAVANEGLQTQQGAIVFPISILTGI